MKRFVCFLTVCVILLGVGAGGSALATHVETPLDGMIGIDPHASRYLASYEAWTSRARTGGLLVEFSVSATRQSPSVGAQQIVVQQRNGNSWTTVRTFFSAITSGMMGSNTHSHGGSVTFIGTPGREYRALVTFFAGGATGDTRTFTTNSTVL